MAVTFSDFMTGLAKAAPMIANTIEKYTAYQMNMYEMQSQQRLREAQIGYYGELSESQELGQDLERINITRAGMELDVLPRTIEIRLANEEAIARGNEANAKIKGMELSGLEGAGGIQYITEKYGVEMETAKQDLARAIAQTEAAYNSITNDNSRTALAWDIARMNAMDKMFDLSTSAIGMLKNPQDTKLITELFDKCEGNVSQFQTGLLKLAGEGKLNDPNTAQRLANIIGKIDEISLSMGISPLQKNSEREAFLEQAVFDYQSGKLDDPYEIGGIKVDDVSKIPSALEAWGGVNSKGVTTWMNLFRQSAVTLQEILSKQSGLPGDEEISTRPNYQGMFEEMSSKNKGVNKTQSNEDILEDLRKKRDKKQKEESEALWRKVPKANTKEQSKSPMY